MSKVVSLSALKREVERLKRARKKIVTTNGVFDILHRGHITYLTQAKKKGDVLIVGVNADASVKRIKGDSRPINNELDRAFCLAALSCVDYVLIFKEDNPIKWLSKVLPHVHVKGGDYRGKEERIIEKEVIEKGGGKVVLVDMVDEYSTTALIGKIVKAYS